MNGYDAAIARAHTESRSWENARTLTTPLTSLRGRLAATATAGFVLTGLMTVLVLHTTRETHEVAVVGLALAFGLSVVFTLLLTRLGPELKGLEQAARAFESGEWAHRIRLKGHDELTHFAAVFNSMAQEISAKQQALEEHARRHSFLADASHELRMPLTIIRGETQVALRAGLQASQDSTEVFERILEQTRVLTRVFDDLFLIARAEAGGLPLNLCVVDLGELVRRVAQDFSTIASESGATVRAEVSRGLVARVDPDRVRQALAALIDNALRHAGPGVRVQVEARTRGDSITITVTDNGPGIDAGRSEELFARFRRGPTRGEGSGLGLSVVRALAEAHGGTASLGNAEQGGAQATLRLPKNTHTTREGWSDVVANGGR
jgi:two-component system sensor histidine kinase MtrB